RTVSGVSPWGTLNLVSPVFRSIAVSTPYGGFAIGKFSRPVVRPPRPAAGAAARAAAAAAGTAPRAAPRPPRPLTAGSGASQIGPRPPSFCASGRTVCRYDSLLLQI